MHQDCTFISAAKIVQRQVKFLWKILVKLFCFSKYNYAQNEIIFYKYPFVEAHIVSKLLSNIENPTI